MTKELICPQCGYRIERKVGTSALIVCPACNSSLFLENEAVRNAGKMAMLVKEPTLLSLRKTFSYRGWRFTPLGRVRYDYGDGFWDEWWVVSDNGGTNWMSVDEGDVSIESQVKDIKTKYLPFEELKIGTQLRVGGQLLTITEKNSCVCVGAEGELPFRPSSGETFNFVDLLGPKGAMFTIEYYPDTIECYKGTWVDPFDIIVF